MKSAPLTGDIPYHKQINSETQAMTQHESIIKLLQNCKELTAFCSQNGWIINDSITMKFWRRNRTAF